MARIVLRYFAFTKHSESASMKKGTIIVILVSTHLLTLALGFFGAALYLRQTLVRAASMTNSLAIISHYSLFTQAQRTLGSDDDYRDALLLFLKALDNARSPDGPLFTLEVYKAEKALTYVRLSRVEENGGNHQESREYMNEARDICRELNWRDCSSERLVMLVEKLDQEDAFSESKDK